MKQLIVAVVLLNALALSAQEPKLVLPVGHTSDVTAAEFSPDGKKLATWAASETVKIWDVNSGKLLMDLDNKNGFDISLDWKKIMTFDDNRVNIFSTETGKQLIVIADSNDIQLAKFSSDGALVATTVRQGADSVVTVWKTSDGSVVSRIVCGSKVSDISFSPKNTLLVQTWNSFSVWLAPGLPLREAKQLRQFNDALFDSKGEKIIGRFFDGVVSIWNTDSGTLVTTVNHGSRVPTCALSPHGNVLITGSYDSGSLKLWDVATSSLLSVLDSNYKGGRPLIFSADSRYVLGVSLDDKLKVWDITERKLWFEKDSITDAGFSAGSTSIIYTTSSEKLFKQDIRSGEIIKTHEGRYFTQSGNGELMVTMKDRDAFLWDDKTSRLKSKLTKHTAWLYDVKYTKDGTPLLLARQDNHITLWDMFTARQLITPSHNIPAGNVAVLSPDGGKIARVSFDDETTTIYDAASKARLCVLEGYQPAIPSYIGFSPSGKRLAIASYGASSIKIWSTITGKLLAQFDHQSHAIIDADFSADDKYIITAGDNIEVNLWNIQTRKKEWTHLNNMGIVKLSGKYMLVGSGLYEFRSKKFISNLNYPRHTNKAFFSPDGTHIVTVPLIGIDFSVINIRSGERKMLEKGYAGNNLKLAAAISPDNKTVATTSSSENVGVLWERKTGKALTKFIPLDATDYIHLANDGFYRASPGGAKLLHYTTRNLSVVGFEQLDIKYNRPDLVQKQIPSPDTNLVHSFFKAYQKRIRKLNIDTTAFTGNIDLPEAGIVNKDTIGYNQSVSQLTLSIHATDPTAKLRSFNIWVNDVPVYGLRGIDLFAGSFDTTVTITLSSGENRVETSVTNHNGIESYREPLIVNYTPSLTKAGKFRFIGIGINRFADAAFNLSWSVNDIQKLAAKLEEKYPGIIIDTLFDASVTKENILALKRKLQEMDVDDKVILSYSGHGILSKELDYYLSTYNMNFNSPEQKGLAYDELESLMDGIRPRKKLMLIDACHSGELDKEEIERIEAATKTLDSLGTSRDTANRSSITLKKSKLGMSNSFELMLSLFVNVSRGTGTTVISAAGGMQYAQERGELQSGVFTYSILEAFNKNETLTVSQLKKIVAESVVRLTNGLQKPTSRNETNSYDWVVW